jgi:hypothetical protein
MAKKQTVKGGLERNARRQLVEELFYDLHASRHQIFFLNLVRGIFFGFGTVLGGTVLVALIVWVLSQIGWIPGVHELINAIQNSK